MDTKQYKPNEFANLIGVSVKTLQRWDRDGILTAYRTTTNRRYYTYDHYNKYTNMRLKQIQHPATITRGWLYTFVRDCITNTELNTYDNIKILQQIVDIVMELPACFPEGIPMTQTIRLDSDLICKRDMINALDRFADKEPEDSDKNVICRMLQKKIHAAM